MNEMYVPPFPINQEMVTKYFESNPLATILLVDLFIGAGLVVVALGLGFLYAKATGQDPFATIKKPE